MGTPDEDTIEAMTRGVEAAIIALKEALVVYHIMDLHCRYPECDRCSFPCKLREALRHLEMIRGL